MGEYYRWFNLDKSEQLDPGPFDTGLKIAENADVGNEYTDAVCTLLDSDWYGDRLIFQGDGHHFFDEDDPAVEKLADCFVYKYDDAEDLYTDVTGRFRLARGKTHLAYVSDDYYEVPYEGPMDREIIHFRYVINDTQRQYYDRKSTPVISPFEWRDGIPKSGIVRLDPLAVLLAAGETEWGYWFLRDAPFRAKPDGMWIGDHVRVSQEPPVDGYEDISDKYYDSAGPLITEPDEAILPIVESRAFKEATANDEGWRRTSHALRLIRQSLDGFSIEGMCELETLLSQLASPESVFVLNVSTFAAYGGVVASLTAYLAEGDRTSSEVYGWLADKLSFPFVITPKGSKYYLTRHKNRLRIVDAKSGCVVVGGRTLRYDSERAYIGLWIRDYNLGDVAKDEGEATFLCSALLDCLEKDALNSGASKAFVLVDDRDRIFDKASFFETRGYLERIPDSEEELAGAIAEINKKTSFNRCCLEKRF